MAQRYCQACGNALGDNETFCAACGAPNDVPAAAAAAPSAAPQAVPTAKKSGGAAADLAGKKNIIIIAGAALVVIIVAIVVILNLTKYQTIDAKELVRVEFKGMDGKGLPSGNEYSVNLLYTDYNSAYQTVDEEGIRSVLKAIEKQQPDITVALLHWGSEFNDQISKTQEKIVEIMADGGVDAIVGTHPHYVQKIGFDEKTGIFIAYSLGDLLGDGDKAGTEYSVILDMEITRSGKTGAVKISNYSYTPIYRYEDEAGNVRLLRIREALTAYENRSINAVTAEDYEAMKTALSRIESRVNG